MKPARDNDERREQIIAALLWYGTWLACAIIAAGMIVGAFPQIESSLSPGFSSYGILKVGVALLILLPIARVTLMVAIFLCERDYAYVAISSFVLAIIAAGILVGLHQGVG
ncbi:hypothetical protein BWP39_09945 [Paraburkholderia acidicola]|uniref:DUF1634 domain-containing protein n=1 Tax=Paraburkholderia acidicola TaxID=1912599 RepID=A0A2A4F2A2_9BURK|nr:DUF1634 domain-containing protein [Paraburkholderia acidicola]PCE27097.1 hypothetical protein BWP39_09945 [Paraburkholderia acidicola]